ncbi:unnamed protein product [Lactuca saligna]|uniref:Uncharacterized protein n=1 Tax=Lactuca saligna TaxID=75948 RepID=A0AA35Z4K1_LACSI|nr:unnamed protein product [Lactuca saligna]
MGIIMRGQTRRKALERSLVNLTLSGAGKRPFHLLHSKQALLLTSTTVQDAPPQEATQRHAWTREDRRRLALGTNPLHNNQGPNTPTNQALPSILPQVSRLDTQNQALHNEEKEQHTGHILSQQAEQENNTDRLHFLEKEVATMRQQILTAEAKAALAEQREEEATREMSETVGHLVR